jgi:hypothetical protein
VVAIIGGFGPTIPGIELYDTTTNTFTRDIALQVSRGSHSAIALACPGGGPCSYGGKVLIVGGFNVLDAEVYDPLLHTSTKVGAMANERGLFNAVQLDNGKVLVGGGNQTGNNQTASVELFDPATGLFTPATDLAVARGALPAIHLADDSVVFVGGWSPSAAAWGSAERVRPGDLLPDGIVNTPYNAAVAFGSGSGSATPPFTFTIKSGALPPAIQLDASTGALSGTPTAAGTFRAVVQITDSSTPMQLAFREVLINVKP